MKSATSGSAGTTSIGEASQKGPTLFEKDIIANTPGYSPPVVEFESYDGTIDSIIISEADIPLLWNDDIE